MKATMDGATFNRLIDAVRAFTSKNSDARPQHGLIQLHFAADTSKCVAYALDGYRVAKECAMCRTVDEDFVVLVSAPPIKANGLVEVEVSSQDDYAHISYGDINFRTKRPEGEMFNAETYIAETMKHEEVTRFGANVDYLLDALKSLKASRATSRKAVIVEFRGPNDPIILRTDDDNPKIVLPTRIPPKEAVSQ